MTVVTDAWRVPPVRVVAELDDGTEAVAWFDALGEIADPDRIGRLEAEHAESQNLHPRCATVAP